MTRLLNGCCKQVDTFINELLVDDFFNPFYKRIDSTRSFYHDFYIDPSHVITNLKKLTLGKN